MRNADALLFSETKQYIYTTMSVRTWLSTIKFSDQTIIDLEKDDIIVIVGPNNAGKSASLKEMAALLQNKSKDSKVVHDITIEKQGSNDDLIEILDKYSVKNTNNPGNILYQGQGFNIWQNSLSGTFSNYARGFGSIVNLFISSLSTEERLKAANPADSINLLSNSATHSIHNLQKDDSLEKRFSDYFRQAFGTDLIVHRNAGNKVPLYVGDRPIPDQGEDRVSIGYLKKLEKLDLLHEQGDGMRSFVGVLLNAFISHHSILFIDEPEAFLHPPQARLLGKMLAKDLPTERQLFLATHSEDFLKGLMDANVDNLKIIRIQRYGEVNKVRILDSNDIREVWSDSLLRHSNVLSGLFHSKVVICESDSDCRFFSAIVAAEYDDIAEIAPDVLFIHCGGKHRIPTAINALSKMDVEISVVTDFDVLNNTNPLRNIYESLGGNWADINSDWQLVKDSIERKRPEYLTVDLKEEINRIFENTNERIFPNERISEIQRALKKTSAWSEAKSIGKGYIPSGDPYQAFERIQEKLEHVGFYIVEVGELECFVRSVGNHGPKWVSEVLNKDVAKDPELETARSFVKKIV